MVLLVNVLLKFYHSPPGFQFGAFRLQHAAQFQTQYGTFDPSL